MINVLFICHGTGVGSGRSAGFAGVTGDLVKGNNNNLA